MRYGYDPTKNRPGPASRVERSRRPVAPGRAKHMDHMGCGHGKNPQKWGISTSLGSFGGCLILEGWFIVRKMGAFHSHGGSPIAGWFTRGNPSKMDDGMGYPYFRKPPFLSQRCRSRHSSICSNSTALMAPLLTPASEYRGVALSWA